MVPIDHWVDQEVLICLRQLSFSEDIIFVKVSKLLYKLIESSVEFEHYLKCSAFWQLEVKNT